jgi:hypothetical protein
MISVNFPSRLMSLWFTMRVTYENPAKNFFLIDYLYSSHNVYRMFPSNKHRCEMYMATYFQNLFISSLILRPEVHKQFIKQCNTIHFSGLLNICHPITFQCMAVYFSTVTPCPLQLKIIKYVGKLCAKPWQI